MFNNNLYNSKNSMNTINNSKLSYFYSKENNYSKKALLIIVNIFQIYLIVKVVILYIIQEHKVIRKI